MQLIDVPVIDLDTCTERVFIHHFTDIHMGAAGCDERQLKNDIRRFQAGIAAGEKHFFTLGGDNINGIGHNDKRFGATAVAPRFSEFEGDDLFRMQCVAVATLFDPIKDYGLFVGTGNHDHGAAKKNNYNAARDLAERLNLPYAGYSAGLRIRLKPSDGANAVYTTLGFWHHGYGAARTTGAKVNMGDRLGSIIEGTNFILTGHVHTPNLKPDVFLTMTKRGKLRLQAHDRLVIIGGSYLKTYPLDGKVQTTGAYADPSACPVHIDYAEEKGYSPVPIGHYGFSLRVAKDERGNNVLRHRPESFTE